MYFESEKNNKTITEKLNQETNKLVPCTEKLSSVTKMFGTRNKIRCYFSWHTQQKNQDELIKLFEQHICHTTVLEGYQISTVYTCLSTLSYRAESTQLVVLAQLSCGEYAQWHVTQRTFLSLVFVIHASFRLCDHHRNEYALLFFLSIVRFIIAAATHIT